MRLASYNLENLFDRAKAMNLSTWAEGRQVLDAYARFNRLLNAPAYGAPVRKSILALVEQLGLSGRDDGEFVILRQNRGRLLKRPKNAPPEIVAAGRADWIGWLELRTEAVDETATRNTAQVVRDVGADVLAVVEVENRTALKRFSDDILARVGGAPYAHAMVIDGNDERGIDVGLMTRADHPILGMRSHVDDTVAGDRVFSRDCPEYEIKLPSGETLVVLVNHLKSKGYGPPAQSNARRRAQARRVREIYEGLRAAGRALIAVVGDLNDTPDSDPLSPLLESGSDLRDVSDHPLFQSDGRPGTYGNGTKSNKIDYILLSPALFAAVTAAGVFRKGVWGGTHGTLWPIYAEMTKPEHAASDHAAIWADLAV